MPRLAAPGAGGELAAIEQELADSPGGPVVLDPLYLAAAGASGSNLYDMGAVLQAIQGVCQAAGCALLVVTHWNKTGDGRGADRITGAGPAAWARVICSVSVHDRASDPDGASTVLLGVELIGGEIADTRFRSAAGSGPTTRPTSAPPLSYAWRFWPTTTTRTWTRPRPPCPKSRQWVLTACAPAATFRRSSSSATAWPRPATRSSPAPSRPPSASWKRPGWRPGARKATAGPRLVTRHSRRRPPKQERGDTMTLKLKNSDDERTREPRMEPRRGRMHGARGRAGPTPRPGAPASLPPGGRVARRQRRASPRRRTQGPHHPSSLLVARPACAGFACRWSRSAWRQPWRVSAVGPGAGPFGQPPVETVQVLEGWGRQRQPERPGGSRAATRRR